MGTVEEGLLKLQISDRITSLKGIEGILAAFEILPGDLVLSHNPLVAVAQIFGGKALIAVEKEFGPEIDQTDREFGIGRTNHQLKSIFADNLGRHHTIQRGQRPFQPQRINQILSQIIGQGQGFIEIQSAGTNRNLTSGGILLPALRRRLDHQQNFGLVQSGRGRFGHPPAPRQTGQRGQQNQPFALEKNLDIIGQFNFAFDLGDHGYLRPERIGTTKDILCLFIFTPEG